MRERKLESVIGVAVICGVVAFLALIAIDSFHYRRLEKAERWLSHTHDVLDQLARVRESFISSELAMHAYVLAANSPSLQRYASARREIERQMNQLRASTADNPLQQKNWSELSTRARLQLAALDRAHSMRDTGGTAAAATVLNEGAAARATRGVLDVTAIMAAEERRLLALRALEARNARRAVVITEGVAVTLLSVTLISGFAWIRRELRARVETQTALASSERRLQDITDNMPVAVGYVDKAEHVQFTNSALRAQTQSPGDPRGMHFRAVLGEPAYEASAEARRRALEGERSQFLMNTSVNAEPRIFEVTCVPDVCADGTILGMYVLEYDITERELLTRELKRRGEQIEELFSQASDAIFIVTADGRCARVNPAACKLLERSAEELLGRPIAELLSLGGDPTLTALQVSATAAAHPERFEWSLPRNRSECVPVEVSIKMLSDGHWFAFVRDISERKRQLQAAEVRAEELERSVEERTAQLRALAADLEMTEFRERRTLAHDLHDDLCQILAAARIRLAPLRESNRPDVRATALEVDGLIDRVNQSTRSLAARLAPAELDELGLVAALTTLATEMHRTFGLKVEVFDSGCEGYLAEASRSILYRAVRELLINAAKHARTGYAEVDCEESNGEIIVRVTDNGVGFDPAKTQTGRGQGFGLATIRQRLLFIGGTLEIKSVPGDATVAVLRAPLHRRAAARAGSEA